MARTWGPDWTDEKKRRRLLEHIETGEAELTASKAEMEAAEKKARPYVEKARQASARHWRIREQLLEDRAALRELVTDPEPEETGVPVEATSKSLRRIR